LSLSLHLFIPGLLKPVRAWARDYTSFPRFNALETLLGRSAESTVEAIGYERPLLELGGLQWSSSAAMPTAALRRLGITGTFHEGAYACLDPVCLQADIGSAYLYDACRIIVSGDEAATLARCFNDHFADRGLHLDADLPDAWHLRLKSPEVIDGYSIREARGRDVTRLLPKGARAGFWHGVMNETQMLFYQLPLNQEREAAGRIPVNGVWLHGAGAMPGAQTTRWTHLWSDDPLVKGIGLRTGAPTDPSPESLDDLLEKVDQGEHLVVLDELSASADYDDFSTWVETLRDLERRWFGPLNGERRVKNWIVHDDTGRRFERGKGVKWPWRKNRPLPHYGRRDAGPRL